MKWYLLHILCGISLWCGLYCMQSGKGLETVCRDWEDTLTGNVADLSLADVWDNTFADISLQQSISVQVNTLGRRSSQGKSGEERLFVSSGSGLHRLVVTYYIEYSRLGINAIQRQAGYYLYGLCRLII